MFTSSHWCTNSSFIKIPRYVSRFNIGKSLPWSWSSILFSILSLELVCCKKWQKIIPDQLLVCGHLKDLNDSKLIINESKLFPWSSRINLVPFRTFRGPLFPKPETGQELFLAVSYSKLAIVLILIEKSVATFVIFKESCG